MGPFGGILAFVGVAVMIAGVGSGVQSIRLGRNGGRATGEVMGWLEKRTTVPYKPKRGPIVHREVVSYWPQVRFVDADGAAREFESSSNADPEKWPIGTSLKVRYTADDAQIDTVGRTWLSPIALTLAGALLVAVAVFAGL